MRKGSQRAKKPLFAIPKFQSREEEAEWFDEHRDEITDFVLKYGKVVGPGRTEKTQSVTLRIPVSDLERAKSIAESTGKPYQRVLKDAMRAGLANVPTVPARGATR